MTTSPTPISLKKQKPFSISAGFNVY